MQTQVWLSGCALTPHIKVLRCWKEYCKTFGLENEKMKSVTCRLLKSRCKLRAASEVCYLILTDHILFAVYHHLLSFCRRQIETEVSRCSSQLGPIVAECRLCSGTRWPTVSWVWNRHCMAAKLSQWQLASSVTKAGFSKFLFFFFLCKINFLRDKLFWLSGWLHWLLNHIPNHMNAFLNQLLASWPFTTWTHFVSKLEQSGYFTKQIAAFAVLSVPFPLLWSGSDSVGAPIMI